jgi:hypothetical protein
MSEGNPSIPQEDSALLSMDELGLELAALEAGSFLSLTDENLEARIRFLHKGFRFQCPVFPAGTTIFRAVRVATKPLDKGRLSYPPIDRVRANGRLNRAGEPMFYGSLEQFGSCLCECRCAEGEHFAVSVWRTMKPLTFNHLGYSRETLDEVKARRELPIWANGKDDDERNVLIRAWQARVFTRIVPEVKSIFIDLALPYAASRLAT